MIHHEWMTAHLFLEEEIGARTEVASSGGKIHAMMMAAVFQRRVQRDGGDNVVFQRVGGFERGAGSRDGFERK